MRPKRKHHWKHLIVGLCLGLAIVAISGKAKPDPLLVATDELYDVTRITFTRTDRFPGPRIVDPYGASKEIPQLVERIRGLKTKIQDESYKRASLGSTNASVQNVALAASKYLSMLEMLYQNYLFNAHLHDADTAKFAPWEYDDLFLRVDETTGVNLMTSKDPNVQRRYNVRHAKNARSSREVEVFVTEQTKVDLETAILSQPSVEFNYRKNIQLLALGESMVNRAAMRGLGFELKDTVDQTLNQCAMDLVAFRLPRPMRLAQMPLYREYGSEKRYNDFILLRPELAKDLQDLAVLPDYGETLRAFFATFPQYEPTRQQMITDGKVDDFEKELDKSADAFRANEDKLWRYVDPKDKEKTTKADLIIDQAVFPVDEIDTAAIAARIAQIIIETRREKLLDELIAQAAEANFPDAKTVDSRNRAAAILNERMAPNARALEARVKRLLDVRFTDRYQTERNLARFGILKDRLAWYGVRGASASKLRQWVKNSAQAQIQRNYDAYTGQQSSGNGRFGYKYTYRNDPQDPDTRFAYTGRYFTRVNPVLAGMPHTLTPISPDDLKAFYFKKLALLAGKEKGSSDKLRGRLNYIASADPAAQSAAKALIENDLVLEYIKNFFEILGADFGDALIKKGVLPFNLDGRNTPLNDVLGPAARKAYLEFVDAVSKPAQLPVAPLMPTLQKLEKISIQSDTLGHRPLNLDALKNTRFCPVGTRDCFFQESPPPTPPKAKPAPYIADEKKRAEAIAAYVDALSVIGLGEKATGKGAALLRDPQFLEFKVYNFRGIEYVQNKNGDARSTLDRTVWSVLDQGIFADVILDEIYGKFPILALRDQEDEEAPTVLDKLAKTYLPNNGNPKFSETYASTLFGSLQTAMSKNVGQVEGFCNVDLRTPRSDGFRKLMMGTTAIRGQLAASNPTFASWDAKLQKESRTWWQATLEDYLEKYFTYLMLITILILAWQAAPFIVGYFSAAGVAALGTTGLWSSATIASASGIAAGTAAAEAGVQVAGKFVLKTWLKKFLVSQFMGPLGAMAMVGSTQGIFMGKVNYFEMPAQLRYQLAVANGQIGMYSMPLVSEAKVQDMVADLRKRQHETKNWLIMDGVSWATYGVPRIVKSLGVVSRIKLNRFLRFSSYGVEEELAAKGLSQAIREEGRVSGVKAYFARLWDAVVGFRNVSALGESATIMALREVRVDTIAYFMPNRNALGHIYLERASVLRKSIDEAIEEANELKKLVRTADTQNLAIYERTFVSNPRLSPRQQHYYTMMPEEAARMGYGGVNGELEERVIDELVEAISITPKQVNFSAEVTAWLETNLQMRFVGSAGKRQQILAIASDPKMLEAAFTEILENGQRQVRKVEKTPALTRYMLAYAKVRQQLNELQEIQVYMKKLMEAPLIEGKPETWGHFNAMTNSDDVWHADLWRFADKNLAKNPDFIKLMHAGPELPKGIGAGAPAAHRSLWGIPGELLGNKVKAPELPDFTNWGPERVFKELRQTEKDYQALRKELLDRGAKPDLRPVVQTAEETGRASARAGEETVGSTTGCGGSCGWDGDIDGFMRADGTPTNSAANFFVDPSGRVIPKATFNGMTAAGFFVDPSGRVMNREMYEASMPRRPVSATASQPQIEIILVDPADFVKPASRPVAQKRATFKERLVQFLNRMY